MKIAMLNSGIFRRQFGVQCMQSSNHQLFWTRSIFSKTGEWPMTLSRKDRFEIEAMWKEKLKILDKKMREDPARHTLPKFYVLSMFPYPSGRLHMGHVRVYTISDVIARFQRLMGKQVIHPMGWDAFGLPAENAAIERGELPQEWTYSNIAHMRTQLQDLGYSFDWEREFATCDPSYYKWTQYIFLKMWEAGLVYQKEDFVNWDPVDKTVLADEQIDQNGRSWRSGAVVEKKLLRQWFIKTTKYVKPLLQGLQDIDIAMWKDVVYLQKNWLGECNGVLIDFKLEDVNGKSLDDNILSVFTTSPETLYGVSHVYLLNEHSLNKKEYYKDITSDSNGDIELNLKAVCPLTCRKLPVFVSQRSIDTENEAEKAVDAKLAVPCLDNHDKSFAEKFNIVYNNIIERDSNDNEIITNSNQLSGLTREQAREMIIRIVKEKDIGYECSGKLKDWLISRQRYWGTPIPMIHCPSCKTVPVPAENLPVELPSLTNLSGTGGSPLMDAHEWKNVKCPKCGGDAQRETDTMDTFVDSSWYFYRYLDSKNETLPFDKETSDNFMPVDLYIGGKEHATLHLYYARFFSRFLQNAGLTSHKEPFSGLLTQGMVMSQSYSVKETGKYLKKEDIDFSGDKPVEKGTGKPLVVQWEKMSKSKHNGVDPEDEIAEYTVDTTRLAMLNGSAPKNNRNWSDQVFRPIFLWQQKLFSLVGKLLISRQKSDQDVLDDEWVKGYEASINEMRNEAVREVTFSFNKTYLLSEGFHNIMKLTNQLKKIPPEYASNSPAYERALSDLIIMVSPMVPMFALELWEGLRSLENKLTQQQWDKCVLEQSWPIMDANHLVPIFVMFRLQINGSAYIPLKDLHSLTLEQAEALIANSEAGIEVVKRKAVPIRFHIEKDVKAEVHYKPAKMELWDYTEEEWKAYKKQEKIDKKAHRKMIKERKENLKARTGSKVKRAESQ